MCVNQHQSNGTILNCLAIKTRVEFTQLFLNSYILLCGVRCITVALSEVYTAQ